jgi:D-alanine-D-alanine ligase
VQSLLEYLGIPYVGQRPSVCRLAWPKAVLPHVVLDYRRIMGVGREDGAASWPEYLALNKACFKEMGAATALDRVSAWFATGYPLAVKPMRGGSAMGVSRVDSQDELAEALFDALSYDDEVLIEEWISGVELAVTVISTGDEVRALAPVEIVPLEKESFFSTQVRFDGLWQSYCPPRPESLVPGGSEAAAEAALAQITEAALEVYRAFGCRDLSRVDIIWDGKAPRVLEMNVSPGMGEGSLVPLACSAAGLPLASVLEQLLAAAVARQAVML